MINVYSYYPKHLPIEKPAVKRSTLILPGISESSHEKLFCLKTQLDNLDEYEIITSESLEMVGKDWLKVRVNSQLELIEDEFFPIEGWVQKHEINKFKNLKNPEKINLVDPTFLELSQKYIGVPYQWGGKTLKETDCSGLIYQIYRELGKIIPRFANGQFKICELVSPKNLSPGDLIFGIYVQNTFLPVHVMIYLDNDQILESCGLPQYYRTHIINFKEKFQLSKENLYNGWPLGADYTIYFGRPQ